MSREGETCKARTAIDRSVFRLASVLLRDFVGIRRVTRLKQRIDKAHACRWNILRAKGTPANKRNER